jgi:hypothetical protein
MVDTLVRYDMAKLNALHEAILELLAQRFPIHCFRANGDWYLLRIETGMVFLIVPYQWKQNINDQTWISDQSSAVL